MTLKATFFFGQGRYTWSESHYMPQYSNLPDGQGQAIQYAGNRVPILGSGATMTGIRLSHVDPPTRDVLDIDQNLFVQVPTWPPDVPLGTYTSEVPVVSMLVRMKATPRGTRNWYIAGCPDVTFATDAPNATGIDFAEPSGWVALLNTFLNSLEGTWAYRQISNAFPTQSTGPPVTNATYPQSIGIVTAASVGLVAGEQAYLTGWRRINPRSPGLSGYHRIVGVLAPVAPATGPWTYFLSQTGNVNPLNFVAPGQIGSLTYNYPLYNDWDPIRVVKRARGGSYALPRGRSRPGGR